MNEASAVALASRTFGLDLENVDEKINIVGVVSPADAEEAVDILPGYGLEDLRNVIDDGSIGTHFGVVSHPSIVFIEADGSYERVTGEVGPWGLRDRIETML